MNKVQLYRHDPLPDNALCYVMDPMCSWCWAFQPVVQQLADEASPDTPVVYVLGGLAPDSEQPMPAAMRSQLEAVWHHIEQRTGVRFNYDFWRNNTPRRSTYPACRAVLAAEALQPGVFPALIEAIQRSYYRQARNPSDLDTLTDLARQIGIDTAAFRAQMGAEPLTEQLYRHLRLRDRLQVQGYPSLVWWRGKAAIPITYGYCDLATTREKLRRAGYPGRGTA